MAAAPMTGMAVAMAKLSDSASVEDEAELPLAPAAPPAEVAAVAAVVVMDWVLGWLVSEPV